MERGTTPTLFSSLFAFAAWARAVRSPSPGCWRTVASCGHPSDWGPGREALAGGVRTGCLQGQGICVSSQGGSGCPPGAGGGGRRSQWGQPCFRPAEVPSQLTRESDAHSPAYEEQRLTVGAESKEHSRALDTGDFHVIFSFNSQQKLRGEVPLYLHCAAGEVPKSYNLKSCKWDLNLRAWL